jgi:AraC family transcriptional regulator
MSMVIVEPRQAAAPGAARPLAVSTELSAVLADFLVDARTAVRRDPQSAARWLDRFERLLAQTSVSATGREAAAPRTGGLAPWQVSRVKRHVEENLSERLSTLELAALVRLSENHFARAFKASLGRPPHAYVIQQRILYAKRLILETDLPFSQIALDAGLADQAHLSRLFRRFFGSTPSACRRQNGTPHLAETAPVAA